MKTVSFAHTQSAMRMVLVLVIVLAAPRPFRCSETPTSRSDYPMDDPTTAVEREKSIEYAITPRVLR